MTGVSGVKHSRQLVLEAMPRRLLGGPCSQGTSQRGCGKMEGSGEMQGWCLERQLCILLPLQPSGTQAAPAMLLCFLHAWRQQNPCV